MGRISRLVGVVGLSAEKGEDLTVVAGLRIVHIDGEVRIAVAVGENVIPLGIVCRIFTRSGDSTAAYCVLQVCYDTYIYKVADVPVVFPAYYGLDCIVCLNLVKAGGVVAVGEGATATAVDGVVLRRLAVHHFDLCLLVSPDAVFPRLNLLVAPLYAVPLVLLGMLRTHEEISALFAVVGGGRIEPCQPFGGLAVIDVALGCLFRCYLCEELLALAFPFRNHHFLQFVLRIGEHSLDLCAQCQCVLQYDFVLAALHILLDMYLPAGADEDIIGRTYIHIAHGTYVRIFVAGGNGFHRSLDEHGVFFVRIFPVRLHSGINIGMYFT